MWGCRWVSKELRVLSLLLWPVDSARTWYSTSGEEMIKAVGAVVAGNVGADGQGPRVLQIHDSAGDRVAGLVEYGPAQITARDSFLGLLLP